MYWGDRMKVLIIEDMGYSRMLMRKALEKVGISDIYESETGATALKMIKEMRFDVISLDIGLPDFNGVSVLKMIKDIDEKTKIIVVSGITTESNINSCIENGADVFLCKPVDLIKYSELVKNMG